MKTFRDREFGGSVPSWLKVEHRADGTVRLRILTVGQTEAIVDIPRDKVADLIANLLGRDEQ